MAKYFTQKLNYSLANEDIAVEHKISESFSPKTIGSIAGAGPRALTLVGEETESLDLFDVSDLQLDWSKLYANSILKFNKSDLLSAYHDKSIDLVALTENEQVKQILGEGNSAIVSAKWEKTFITFSKFVKKVLGRKTMIKLEKCQCIEEQRKILRSRVTRLKWNFILSIIGNKSLMNSLLYKGDFIQKNKTESYLRFYQQRFDHLLDQYLIKENFFLSLCFFGEISKDCSPLNFEGFDKLKENLAQVKLSYNQGDVVKALSSGENSYDYFSYSDVPSYFDEELGKSFIQLAKPSINIGGVICVRYYLRVHKPDLEGFEDITDDFKELISSEKVGVYDFGIYKRVK